MLQVAPASAAVTATPTPKGTALFTVNSATCATQTAPVFGSRFPVSGRSLPSAACLRSPCLLRDVLTCNFGRGVSPHYLREHQNCYRRAVVFRCCFYTFAYVYFSPLLKAKESPVADSRLQLRILRTLERKQTSKVKRERKFPSRRFFAFSCLHFF